MLVPLTADQVLAYYEGNVTDAVKARVTTLIPVVEIVLERSIPGLSARVTIDSPTSSPYRSRAVPVELYTLVVCNTIARTLRNPGPYNTESEDGYSYGKNAQEASANLWVTDSDLDLLRQAPAAASFVPRLIHIDGDPLWGGPR